MTAKPAVYVGSPQSVTSSASNVSIFGANSASVFRSVFNESTATLYLLFNGTPASLTLYTVRVAPNTFFQFPAPVYTSQVNGIWDAANGFARTMEY
jgi:hypothetical protein